jgi:6-pyruvoyltetrahydropterin/6-carboxytetrahydropterin synthase
MFGLCSNPNWHGHNYVLWVTVKGPLDPETGFVTNLKDLSSITKNYVVSKFDHRNINLEVDFMKDKLATTENLAISIWEQLEAPIAALGIQLHSIKIQETENNFAEYFGS